MRSVVVIGQTCPVAVQFVVSSALAPRTRLTTTRALASDAAPDCGGCAPLPEETIYRERPRAMGVTKEHPLRRKTAGFRGVTPGITPGAMSVRLHLPNRRSGQQRRAVPARRPSVQDVTAPLTRRRRPNHTLPRHFSAVSRAPAGPDCHECRAAPSAAPGRVATGEVISPEREHTTAANGLAPASGQFAVRNGRVERYNRPGVARRQRAGTPVRDHALGRPEDRQATHQSNAALR